MVAEALRAGVLLVNLGTPDAPTTKAVRRYLREFLSDPFVVNLPAFFWRPLLELLILPLRAPKSARLYQKIWTEDGSPLKVTLQKQVQHLQNKLPDSFVVQGAMSYGQPSVANAIDALMAQGISKLIVLPLYPQYSNATTAPVFDAVEKKLKHLSKPIKKKLIHDYHHHPDYIRAVADSIQYHWAQHPRSQKLIFSFHGLPEVSIRQGDPYYAQCNATAQAITEHLNLKKNEWECCFQSRFGLQKWLQPYTDVRLKNLPTEGVRTVDVVCPGFAADCLETLEEIAIQGREQFLNAGGSAFHYIDALNENVDYLAELLA